MPRFDQNACDRIAEVVRRFEATYDDLGGPGGPNPGADNLRWYQLTEDLDSETHEAAANPGRWTASGDGGKGSLAADTSITRTVRDTLGDKTADAGDWLLCRPLGSANGMVWEIVTSSVDEKVKVTAEDTEAGYLADKLVGDGD